MNLRQLKRRRMRALKKTVVIDLMIDVDLLAQIKQISPRDPRGFIMQAAVKYARKVKHART